MVVSLINYRFGISNASDHFSFIYRLYQGPTLPWVYGGEYPDFLSRITQFVEAWMRLGLRIYFVFDGWISTLMRNIH